MKKNQVKWLVISIAFSVIVLAFVLYLTIDEQTVDYLSRLNPVYFAFAVVLHLTALCFWALRIKLMAKYMGYQVRFAFCLNLVFANLLVAAVTPSQAGGEPVRVHELYRAHVRVGDATAIVIMERVLDGIVLGAIGAVAMFILSQKWSSLELNIAGPMFASWIMVSVFVLIFVYSVRNPEFLKRLLKRISGWLAVRWHSQRFKKVVHLIDHEVDNFHGGLVRFVGKGKIGLAWGLIFTFLFWSFEFLIASFVLMGLDQPPFFVESFIVQLVIALLMMIPLTPGGSGIAELSASSLYGLFIPSSIVGVFVVLWRLILYYINIIIGILASLYIVRREIILRRIGLR